MTSQSLTNIKGYIPTNHPDLVDRRTPEEKAKTVLAEIQGDIELLKKEKDDLQEELKYLNSVVRTTKKNIAKV